MYRHLAKRMRPEIVHALVVLLLASCARAPSQDSSTVADKLRDESRITVDDVHDVVAQESADVPSYKVSPSKTIVLDSTGYTVRVSPVIGVSGPNAVHVYQGHSTNMYRAPWQPSEPVTLNAETLQCLNGDDVFSGFRAGQRYIIAIGHDNAPVAPGTTISLKPMWTAVVDVASEEP